MKCIKSFKFFCFLFVPTLFSFAQNSTIVGHGLELYHESSTDPNDSGNEYFYFGDTSTVFSYYEEDGEWEMGTFEFTNSPGRIVLMWGEGDYADISLNFSTNNLTFTYHEINEETGNIEQSGSGTGTFNFIPNASLKPPFSRFFEDDFSSLSNTSSNFALNHGETIEGLTISQNQVSGIYSFSGTYTSDDDDTEHDRWFEIYANTLLPMNKSWIVEAELFLDQLNESQFEGIDYMHAMLHLDFDSQDFGFFEVGSRYNGNEFSSAANAYYEPGNSYSNSQYESSNAPVSLSSNSSFVYRIINDADDYQLRFEVDTTNDAGVVETQTLMLLEWDDGWVETNGNHGYYQGTHFRDWRSIGDQFVQPSMSFELPHSWSNSHGSELTMYDLQGGEIGFRKFSVQPNPEIIEFDDGEDFPSFYNKLSTEVGEGGNTSRYHLLKGLHDLAHLVESTSSNSLKQFATSLGVQDSILDFTLADSPLVGTYEFELDRAFETGELALFFQDSFIPQLESIDAHFAQVSDTVIMETVMTGAEEDVTVDATDVKVLRAMVNLLGAFTSLQSAYDWNYNLGDLQDLDMEVTETSLEEVRAQHPTLFGVRSVTQLQKAKAFLQSAVNVYKEASSGLRTSGRYATPQNDPDFLFVLDESDFEDESQFISDLNEFYDALSNNYTFTDDEEYSGTVISLSAFFNGGLDLPKLLPDSVGDQLSADQLTDPTIGGILPGATYANSLFLQDLREEFYDDELIEGQPVRHDSREDALQDFDYLTYLDLNEDLGDWFQTEASAKQHFYERGFWSERRYFYYPYESNSGSVENLVNDNLVGQKVSTSGIIADLSNLEFQIDYYFIDSVNVAVHYSSNDSSVMPEHWALEKYFFKRLSNESGSFVLINNAGEKLIANVSFQTSSSGTTNLRFIGNEGNAIWSQGSGSWNVSSLVETEIPAEIFLDSVTEDFAPYYLSSGLDGLSPSLESNDTFWPGYREQVTFDNYDGWKGFYAQVTLPNQNGFDYENGNGGFDYLKIGKNSAILTLRFEDPNNWNSDEKRFMYHLQFTDENSGVYVKYSDYITELDVTTGLFKFNSLSATSRFAWEDYDDFESDTINSEKWETAYFSGGTEPRLIDEYYSDSPSLSLELKGNAYSGNDPIKIPSGSVWVDAVSESQGESNSAIFIFDDTIIGVQAKLKLPYDNSEQAGVYISAPFTDAGIELALRGEWQYEDEWGYSYTSSQPYFSYHAYDQNDQIIGKKKAAYTDQWYTVSVIRTNNQSTIFVNGEKLSVIESLGDVDAWMLGAFNDNGDAFSAFVDDVRVLRYSDSEVDDFEKIYVSGGSPNGPVLQF